jgi:hypothetical protein
MSKMNEEYFNYLQSNKESLIAPILGLYKMKKSNKLKYHFVLMRNLAIFPRDSIERVYDMKGSTDDREVLTKSKIHESLSKITLKDTDFKNLEKKVYVENQLKKRVVPSLIQDSLFFASMGIMDYSLLVFKINLEKLDPIERELSERLQLEDYYFLKSTNEPHIVYHIGLIDYLQKWNMKKIMEKYTKQVLLKKKDPSAQDPKVYRERFVKFIEEIF